MFNSNYGMKEHTYGEGYHFVIPFVEKAVVYPIRPQVQEFDAQLDLPGLVVLFLTIRRNLCSIS